MYDTERDCKFGQLHDCVFTSNSTMIGSIQLEYEEETSMIRPIESQNPAIAFEQKPSRDEFSPYKSIWAAEWDTLGQIKKKGELIEGWVPEVIKTHDNKYLFYNINDPYYYKYPSAFLYKFNENLEYDSVYTQPMTYDYLCDHPIPNDTLDLRDYIEVGINQQINQTQNQELAAFPNPASDIIHIKLPEYIEINKENEIFQIKEQHYKYLEDAYIQFIDMQGKIVKKIQPKEPNLSVSILDLHKGIYGIQLMYKGKKVNQMKFIRE